MKKIIVIAIVIVSLAACKTTEENYRAAYEKTIAAREEADHETIYGAQRRDIQHQAVISGTDTIPVVIEQISPAGGDKKPAPVILAYNVVAGRFKQQFNAFSLRDRLVEAGYKDAAVVKTAEPYYYIITSTFASPKDAKAALEKLKADAPVAMSSPLPFILHDPRK